MPLPAASKTKIAVLFLSFGTPDANQSVFSYLNAFFKDRHIIQLPVQKILAPVLALMRTPFSSSKYNSLPLRKSPHNTITLAQGTHLITELKYRFLNDFKSIDFSFYNHFRYSKVQLKNVLERINNDGIEKVILMPQYPFYSCLTTGAYFNDVYNCIRNEERFGQLQFSSVTNFGTNPKYVNFFISAIKNKVREIQAVTGDGDVLIVFTAHSLPVKAVLKGDAYARNVQKTVEMIMSGIDGLKYLLTWQSGFRVGRWLWPSTLEVAECAFGNRKKFLLVPIGFLTENLETLYDLDVKIVANMKGLAFRLGIPDVDENVISALADSVENALKPGDGVAKLNFKNRCFGCRNSDCVKRDYFFENRLVKVEAPRLIDLVN